MESTMQKLLRKYYVDGIFHTHVSLIQPKGRYQFNRQGLEEFWTEYSDLLLKTDDLPILGIAEKSEHYLPVLVDVDLKIRDDGDFEGEKLYTDHQVREVIQVYQSVLRKIVDNCSDEKLTCVLLEKDMYTISKNEITYIKHGFHLHFPYCFLSKVDQEVHLIPRVKGELTELKTFAILGIENSGDIIDKSCCKVPWLMYGSRKSETSQPYLVTKVYNSEMEEISLEKAFKRYQLYDNKERLIQIKGRVKELLPRILSIVPYGRQVSELKTGLASPLKEKLRERAKTETKNFRRQTISDQLAIAKRLLPMVADFRTEDYNEWMTIGWTLYNISEGSSEGLDLWCEFSGRCEEKYDEGTCIFQWERMIRKDLTLGTLRYYAGIDNPAEYQKFKQEEAEKFIRESLNGSHNDIAKALYAEFGDEFVCASITGKVWFQFNNHKWEQIEEGIFLREKISEDIVKRFTEAGKELFGKLSQTHDKGEESMVNTRIKQVQKMSMNLKAAPYKSNVMKECVRKGTLVTLSSGLSMKIEDMVENQKVLSWNDKKEGLTIENQFEFLPKGKKECLDITLGDGTVLSVTDNHKILCNGEWTEAKNLKPGNELMFSLQQPIYSYIKPKKPWILTVGSFVFTDSTEQEYKKALAFARVLGYVLTDGSLVIRKNNVSGTANFALKLDANTFLDDIKLITGKCPVMTIGEIRPGFVNSQQISIMMPNKLTRGILGLSGIPIGRRVSTKNSFPDFVFKPNLPLPILREFIAGLWGGDGHSPSLYMKQDIMRSTSFSKSKLVQYENELTQSFVKLQTLLGRFGINKTTIITSKYFSCGERDDECVEKRLSVSMDDYLTFVEQIGIRYCSDKAVKLNVFAYYRRMREKTEQQYNKVVERVKKISNYEPGKRRGIKNLLNEAHRQICKEEVILVPECVKPKYGTIIHQIQTGNNSHRFKNFPKPSEFLESIGALEMFTGKYAVSSDDEVIPTFPTKIIDIRSGGTHDVYDINVGNGHSFLANGIVVHNCMEVFYDKRFREKLDTNAYLIAFNNGVYDLKLNIFRPGRPEDFISKSMPIDYVNYDENDEKVQEVYSFLEQVFPDKSVRSYFLDTSCQVFVGGNQQKIVLFWTGDGDNGKSVTQSFFEQMLGKLAIKFNTNIVTGKKPSAGAAHADLARAGGGVRWAVLEEPDNDEMINVGILKHLSGNDSFYARDLFERGKDGREITPMFKLVFIANKLPKMKYSDKATWNRIRVVPFEATFCREDDPAPESHEEQLLQKRFPMDKKFSLKIPGLVSAFAWVLLQHRIKTQNHPIIEPEKVKIATSIYRRQNDIYRQFLDERIIEDKDRNLSLTDLYSQFKEWFREAIPNHTIPPRSEVEEYFGRLWGEPDRGKKWNGFRFRVLQDDLEAGEAILLEEDDLVNYNDEGKDANLPPL